jgi:hypothetical protein
MTVEPIGVGRLRWSTGLIPRLEDRRAQTGARLAVRGVGEPSPREADNVL